MSKQLRRQALEPVLLNARPLIWMCGFFFMVASVWAYYAEVDIITIGQGKVIPSKQVQVVQNLEGGILQQIYVNEGDFVDVRQELLRIDATRFESDFRERELEYAGLKGNIARLNAELASVRLDQNYDRRLWREAILFEDVEIDFAEQSLFPELSGRIQALKDNRMNALKTQLKTAEKQVEKAENEIIQLNSKLKNLSHSYELTAEVYNMTEPLAKEGVVSEVEFLRLLRESNELLSEVDSIKLQLPKARSMLDESISRLLDVVISFRAQTQQQLSESHAQLAQVSEARISLKDRVDRTTVYSPLKGIVKKINITTLGGVIQPGQDLIEIVPVEDTLLIEAKVLPEDIGFLRPGLTAIVKLSAYDFSIYGGLQGSVEQISADTSEDDAGNVYYLVKVRTSQTLAKKDGSSFSIIPGMGASVDIITGQKRILDYMLAPLIAAKGRALRER